MPRKPKNNVDVTDDDVERSASYRDIEHDAESHSDGKHVDDHKEI